MSAFSCTRTDGFGGAWRGGADITDPLRQKEGRFD
jgi:hypothetical protein